MKLLKAFIYLVRARLALTLTAGCCLALSAQAQHNATLYFMRDLPVVSSLNPAFQPEAGSVYVGIPVFSSLYVGGGVTARGATMNRLMGDHPNLRSVAEKISTFEGGHAKLEVNLLNFGLLVRDMYFTLDVTTKVNADLSVPGSLVKMAWYGNAPSLGQPISLEGLGGQLTAYTEVALGFSKEVLRDNITVGGRLKYLMGHAYAEAYLGPNSFIYTDPETWNITAGLAPNLYFAGLPIKAPRSTFDVDEEIEVGSYSPRLAGSGAGIDLGFEIRGERFITSGSLTNLGFIGWKQSEHVEADGGYHIRTFRGVENANSDMMAELKDSLLNITMHGYTTHPLYRWTDPTMQFSVSYKLHENFYAGGLVGMNISRYNTYPLLALAVSTQKLPINGALSYSYSHNHNLGLGVVFGRRGGQLHLICDNVLAANPRAVRQTNLRMGVNLLLGAPKNTDPLKQTWELLSPTKEEVKANKKAAKRAAKENKKPLGPLNRLLGAPASTPVNKAPLNAAPQESKPSRRSQGTLSSPAGQEQPRPKVKKKPLN